MNFNFNETAGVTSGSKQLEPNKIHLVKFEGLEIIDGVEFKNGNKGNVLDIKFTSEAGNYTHRIFEPTEKDFEDRDSQYGKNPSNVKAMMLLFKHLIDAVNPELGKAIDKGEKAAPTATSWAGLRKLMVEATLPGVGKETKIKLISNSAGYATFPYFASYSKEGKLYMSTFFIGDSIYWTAKEQTKLKNAATAKPTPASDEFSLGSTPAATSQNNGDLDFEL
jgi:hypothetical protein